MYLCSVLNKIYNNGPENEFEYVISERVVIWKHLLRTDNRPHTALDLETSSVHTSLFGAWWSVWCGHWSEAHKACIYSHYALCKLCGLGFNFFTLYREVCVTDTRYCKAVFSIHLSPIHSSYFNAVTHTV